MHVPHQPLRILPFWRVDWNTLYEIDPTEENVRAGYFGGSSLFSATSESSRLAVDVVWRPEDDPAGEYILQVFYVPWERTESGRRRKDIPIDYQDARLVHEVRTRDRLALVRELEAVFLNRDRWVEHN